jgi:pyruvate kinase
LAEAKKTIYLVPGIVFHLKPKKTNAKISSAVGGNLPRREGYLLLQPNDLLLLTRHQRPGHSAILDENNTLLKPATIGCTLPAVLNDVQTGEPIWFDDGKIGGKIERKTAEGVWVRILQTPPGGHRLRAEKGINLPESHLRLGALSEEDLRNLEFIVQHADAVSLSFANRPEDVEGLLEHIREMGKGAPGIILKIETRQGFDNLPALLLAAMQSPLCGVMIARGDLAIEAGFGRLAEVQEQILWFCEAAHMPVIWATQVLEGLAKSGLPSRAEITDAAMGERAECIMLNKGEHIVAATHALVDILHRMQDHQTKKRSLLRRLSLSEKFFMNYGK